MSKKLFYFHDIDKKDDNNFNYHPSVLKLKKLINKMNNNEKEQINKDEINLLKTYSMASMNKMNEMRNKQKQKKRKILILLILIWKLVPIRMEMILQRKAH